MSPLIFNLIFCQNYMIFYTDPWLLNIEDLRVALVILSSARRIEAISSLHSSSPYVSVNVV
ncbi:hypothetical protein E5S67_05257 [Microcoleus sp. IPMA8]|uniref:Uncharacterized protein n=1 Tax=Microcoleus asticus IPMA8 TaxID=2563858 RepID=A0ABX2D6F2_9CYAN|nr:hypothetical protein [Microcoleus asticus IPMA8]